MFLRVWVHESEETTDQTTWKDSRFRISNPKWDDILGKRIVLSSLCWLIHVIQRCFHPDLCVFLFVLLAIRWLLTWHWAWWMVYPGYPSHAPCGTRGNRGNVWTGSAVRLRLIDVRRSTVAIECMLHTYCLKICQICVHACVYMYEWSPVYSIPYLYIYTCVNTWWIYIYIDPGYMTWAKKNWGLFQRMKLQNQLEENGNWVSLFEFGDLNFFPGIWILCPEVHFVFWVIFHEWKILISHYWGVLAERKAGVAKWVVAYLGGSRELTGWCNEW